MAFYFILQTLLIAHCLLFESLEMEFSVRCTVGFSTCPDLVVMEHRKSVPRLNPSPLGLQPVAGTQNRCSGETGAHAWCAGGKAPLVLRFLPREDLLPSPAQQKPQRTPVDPASDF